MGIMSHLLTPEKSPIWIGCDHGGHELKSHVLAWLAERSILFHDAGCNSTAMVRYPYFAAQVAEAIVRGEAIRGILICSTGIGMSIIANKYRGIRASLCTSTYMGRMTRAHNDSNVLCLGGKITGVFEALDILEMWLKTPYEAGRHSISLGLIGEAEQAMSGGSVWNPGDPMVTTKDMSEVPVV
jgi:ribose 5-phosphate isomerase B